jgi:hypothetical protein
MSWDLSGAFFLLPSLEVCSDFMIGWESKRRLNCAQHTFLTNQKKGKKEIIHSIRYLQFAQQIIQFVRSPPPQLFWHPPLDLAQ